MKNNLVYFLLIGALAFSGCSKDEDDDDNNDNQNPTPTTPDDSAPYPSFADGSGTLVAIETINTSPSPFGPPIETAFGTAVAIFYNNPGDTTFLDAGEVKVEDEGLTIQQNKAYVHIPGFASPNGIDFDLPVDWDVAGSAQVDGFTQSVTMGFPDVEQISSGDTVSKADGYTLTCPNVSGSDSVIFQVGEVLVTKAGSPSFYNFSSAELSGLTEGPSIVQIAAYKFEENTIGGKKYYFVNETTVSKLVTVE